MIPCALRLLLPAALILAIAGCAPRGQVTGQAAAAAPAEPSSTGATQAGPAPSAAAAPSAADELFAKAGFDVPSRELMSTDFSLETLQGKKVRLSSEKGKVVILSFWATWCGPCQQEMPEMQALYEDLKGRGLEILAVDVMEDKATVDAFRKAHGYTFPVLLDADGKIAGLYGAQGLPTNYVIDQKGRIVARVVGIGGPTWTSPEMRAVFGHLLAP